MKTPLAIVITGVVLVAVSTLAISGALQCPRYGIT